MKRILIVEDERRLADTLADILEDAGYETDTAPDGNLGLSKARSGGFDAMILDVMLPGLNGFQIAKLLRREALTMPILMLTARGQLSDRVQGLDSGADYYLTKPFENEELLACLRTLLRRGQPAESGVLSFGDLILTPSLCTLSRGEKSLVLSARELELMQLLMQHTSQYLPKETLLSKIWGYDAPASGNSVEAYISFLRKKLHLLGSEVQIRVVRNIGYRLEVSEK